MKKYLILLIIGVMAAGIVMATPQGVEVEIGDDITMIIKPTVINFSSVIPGTADNPAVNGPISFNATGSNVNITVVVTNVTGVPFDKGLELDNVSPMGRTFQMHCVIVNDICTYSIVNTDPTLNVPKGSPAGMKTGTITYLITGVPP